MHEMTQLIKQWASAHYGLAVADSQIEERVPALIASYDLNQISYIQALQTADPIIVNATIEAFTVQESYFFRDSSLFHYLEKTLLPNLIIKKRQSNDYQFTIWSAGCSYGEEIYSIAILLDALLPDIQQWKINLIATDINQSALGKAQKGIYTQSSLRVVSRNILWDYFKPEQQAFFLKKKIIDMVKFEFGNIAQMYKKNAQCDFILCRNVFIYLNKQAIVSALSNFYDSLVDDGNLFLGPSDLVTYYPHKFSREIVNDIFLLKKAAPKAPIPVVLVPQKPDKTRNSPADSQEQAHADQFKVIRQLLDNKKYQDVLKKTDNFLSDHKNTALIYRYKGEAYIGLGDTATAILYLKKSIALDPFDASSHFLSGLVEIEMKNIDEAVASLQKALYIKNTYPEAAYHLSLLYLQNDQWDKGIKLLKKSLIYANKWREENQIICRGGTFEQLIQAINASINYYQGQHKGSQN